MSERARLPRWLKLANPVIAALQRRGVVIGTMRLLSVPGRKSGKLRMTPVSPLMVEGERYIIAGLEEADWVKNARVAGWGLLARGQEQERVNLVELCRGSESPSSRPAQGETRYPRHATSRITGRSSAVGMASAQSPTATTRKDLSTR